MRSSLAIILMLSTFAFSLAKPGDSHCHFELLQRGDSLVPRETLNRLLGKDKFDYRTAVNNAIQETLKVEGEPGPALARKRAALMNDFFEELQSATGRQWKFFPADFTAEGSYAFRAPGLPILLLVRGADGAIFRTIPPQGDLRKWTPSFEEPTFTRYYLRPAPP